MKYPSQLVSKETIAEGTMAFHFAKPDGFTFKAGQTVDITLINPPETDVEGNTRTFSIAATPTEKYLTIATRMRDTAFKRSLKNADAGLNIELDGPYGSFTLHQKESRPAIMLVGGIGITPFLSMAKDATERKLTHKIYLFYSNRRPEDAAFLNDLEALAKENPNFMFIPTMTDMANSKMKWTGETGYITEEMIMKHVSDMNDALYYSAGPQAMVAAMRTIVTKMGVNEDDFKTEEFTGY